MSFVAGFFALIGKILGFLWGVITAGIKALLTFLALFLVFFTWFADQDVKTKLIAAGLIAAGIVLLFFFGRPNRR